jgi:putative DNA primase/helicase
MNAAKVSYALTYARYRFRVFPCHEIENDGFCSCGATACNSAGKHPRIKGWQQQATINEAQIVEWWGRWPNANIGVPCGERTNLTVLDVDPRHGGDALGQADRTTTLLLSPDWVMQSASHRGSTFGQREAS